MIESRGRLGKKGGEEGWLERGKRRKKSRVEDSGGSGGGGSYGNNKCVSGIWGDILAWSGIIMVAWYSISSLH